MMCIENLLIVNALDDPFHYLLPIIHRFPLFIIIELCLYNQMENPLYHFFVLCHLICSTRNIKEKHF